MPLRLLLPLLVLLLAGGVRSPLGADEVQVPPPPVGDQTDLAELPFWPVGMLVPDGVFARIDAKQPPKKPRKRKLDQAEILVWIPPGATRIRSLFIIPSNTDSKHIGEHAAVRDICAKHEMAIVYLRNHGGIHYLLPTKEDTDLMQLILDAVAERVGIVEIKHAPWVLQGKSSLGRFPIHFAWAFPKRTIACITYHGEVPPWPLPDWAAEQHETIPYLNINGSVEWEGTWYRHVRPNFLNYRATTPWLPHQVVLPGIGHGNYPDANGSPGWGQPIPAGQVSCLRVWDYIALYLDKVLILRVAEDSYPTDGPTVLKQIDADTTGILVHPRAPEVVAGYPWHPIRTDPDGTHPIIDHIKEPGEVLDPDPGTVAQDLLFRPAAEVPAEERRGLLWMPDMELVEKWMDLETTHLAEQQKL